MNNILAEGLRAHNIPVPYRFSNSNGFMRWGKSNEYWARSIGEGYVFGDWRRGTKFTIFPNGRTNPTKQECIEIAKIKAEEHKQQERIQREATKKANALFESLKKADLSHHYLLEKGITEIPDSIKQIKQELVIPLQDIYGELNSLQFINPDGKKRFLSKARKKGCFYSIGEIVDGNAICLCEGVATGLSLWSIVHEPVVVAFDAGNLKSVAIDLRRKYPNSKIIIAADNDLNSEYNTGVKKAKEAAKAVGNAIVLYPVYMDKEKNLIKMNVDWNDIYCEYRDKADVISKKIEIALKVNIECIKFYTHEAKLAKQNNIYMKGE